MKYLSCYVLLIVTCSGLAGCFARAANLNVMHMGPPYHITAYERGQPIGQRTITALSSDEQAIAHWIEANKHGWRPSLGDHPPGRVIQGDGFTLNFTDKLCILNIPPDPHAKGKGKGKTEPIVLQKRLTPGDMELFQVLNAGL